MIGALIPSRLCGYVEKQLNSMSGCEYERFVYLALCTGRAGIRCAISTGYQPSWNHRCVYTREGGLVFASHYCVGKPQAPGGRILCGAESGCLLAPCAALLAQLLEPRFATGPNEDHRRRSLDHTECLAFAWCTCS